MNTSCLIKGIEDQKIIIDKYLLFSDYAVFLRLSIYRISQLIGCLSPEIAEKLRLAGLRFNTSIINPNEKLLDNCGLVEQDKISQSWGSDVAFEYDLLSQAIKGLEDDNSLMKRQFLLLVNKEVEMNGIQNIRVLCHFKDRNYYVEYLNEYGISLSDENFICSLSDYRKADFFSVLFVLGPLRHFGWSSKPRVIISAPRYKKLIQLVWSDLKDSPDFGCDPLIKEKDYLATYYDLSVHEVKDKYEFCFPVGVGTTETLNTLDDLEFYNQKPKDGQYITDCYLIRLGADQGMLLKQGSEHIIFEGNERLTPFKLIKSKDMEPKQILVLHDINADLGAGENIDLKLGILWKKALSEMYTFNWETLISRMRQNGINLKNLELAASHWRIIDEKKIHAPQSQEHFRILIENVLPQGCLNGSTWLQAWREIEIIRAKLRVDGRIKSEIIQEELVKKLNIDATKHRVRAQLTGTVVYEEEQKEDSLIGTINFCPIIGVTSGYRASYEKIGVIDNIDKFEIYRTES